MVRSFTVTPAMDRTLQRLRQEGSDFTGWTVSTSAVIRALLRYVEEQPSLWAHEQLWPRIEQEIASGVVWGSKRRIAPTSRLRARRTPGVGTGD